MELATVFSILSFLAVLYVGYIQQSQIKTLKLFNEIFDPDKVKKYVELHKETSEMEKKNAIKELNENSKAAMDLLISSYDKDKSELNMIRLKYQGIIYLFAGIELGLKREVWKGELFERLFPKGIAEEVKKDIQQLNSEFEVLKEARKVLD